MRVFLRSLRCFFLAMRLRRFLMTDPTRPPFLGTADDGHANALARQGRLDTHPTLESTPDTGCRRGRPPPSAWSRVRPHASRTPAAQGSGLVEQPGNRLAQPVPTKAAL